MDTNIAEQVLAEFTDCMDAPQVVDVLGLSSARVCRYLNRLVSRMDCGEHYLEIGTWQGKTLLSAAYDNPGRICVGCDKFRLWAPYTGFGIIATRALYANIARYRGRTAEIRFHAMNSARLFAPGARSLSGGGLFL